MKYSAISPLGYQPAFDGLRALALMMVMCLHAHFQLGKNGYVGVDIFFVLSGFLITTLILEEHFKTNRISLRQFWLRRFIRLFPALYIVLFFVLLYALSQFIQSEYKTNMLNEVLSSALYVSNISWTWGWGGQSVILGHTWSLAVEQQFYFIWPIILFAFLKIKRVDFAFFFLLAAIVSSITAKHFIGNGIFYSLFHESLFVGCLFALIRWLYPTIFNLPSWIGPILLIGITIFAFYRIQSTAFINESIKGLLYGLISTLLIVSILKYPKGLLARILSTNFLVWIGKISYALYLWHLPVFRWFQWHSTFSPSISFFMKFMVALCLAALSWHFIERPINQKVRYLLHKL